MSANILQFHSVRHCKRAASTANLGADASASTNMAKTSRMNASFSSDDDDSIVSCEQHPTNACCHCEHSSCVSGKLDCSWGVVPANRTSLSLLQHTLSFSDDDSIASSEHHPGTSGKSLGERQGVSNSSFFSQAEAETLLPLSAALSTQCRYHSARDSGQLAYDSGEHHPSISAKRLRERQILSSGVDDDDISNSSSSFAEAVAGIPGTHCGTSHGSSVAQSKDPSTRCRLHGYAVHVL